MGDQTVVPFGRYGVQAYAHTQIMISILSLHYVVVSNIIIRLRSYILI